MISTIQDVLLAYTGLSNKRNLAIAAKIEAALEPCIAAERAAAAEAMREACLDAAEAERQDWLQIAPPAPVALGCAHVKRRIRALPIPSASALAERDERMREEGGIPAATLSGLRDGTLVAVPRKLLTEAHACMRACGWQLAPAAEQQGDGVLQLAVAEVEAAFLDLLAAAPEAPGRG